MKDFDTFISNVKKNINAILDFEIGVVNDKDLSEERKRKLLADSNAIKQKYINILSNMIKD